MKRKIPILMTVIAGLALSPVQSMRADSWTMRAGLVAAGAAAGAVSTYIHGKMNAKTITKHRVLNTTYWPHRWFPLVKSQEVRTSEILIKNDAEVSTYSRLTIISKALTAALLAGGAYCYFTCGGAEADVCDIQA